MNANDYDKLLALAKEMLRHHEHITADFVSGSYGAMSESQVKEWQRKLDELNRRAVAKVEGQEVRYVKRGNGTVYENDYRKLEQSNGWWVLEEINEGDFMGVPIRREFCGSFAVWKDITAAEYESRKKNIASSCGIM